MKRITDKKSPKAIRPNGRLVYEYDDFSSRWCRKSGKHTGTHWCCPVPRQHEEGQVSDKYDEKAPSLCHWCQGGTVNCPYCKAIARALRESAAEAFLEAAEEVECFDSQYAPAFVKDKDCPPCDDCVKGARLRGRAANLRSK